MTTQNKLTVKEIFSISDKFLIKDYSASKHPEVFSHFKETYPLKLEGPENYPQFMQSSGKGIHPSLKLYHNNVTSAVKDSTRQVAIINGCKIDSSFTTSLFEGFYEDNSADGEQLKSFEVINASELEEDNELEKEFEVVPTHFEDLERFRKEGERLRRCLKDEESVKKDELFDEDGYPEECGAKLLAQDISNEKFLIEAYRYFFKEVGSSNASNMPTDALLKVLALNMNQNSFTYAPCVMLPFNQGKDSERVYSIDSQSSNKVTISISHLNNIIDASIFYDLLDSRDIKPDDYLSASKKEGPFVNHKLTIVIEDDGNGIVSYKQVTLDLSVYNGSRGMCRSYDILTKKHGKISEFSTFRDNSISSFLSNIVSLPVLIIDSVSRVLHEYSDLLTCEKDKKVSESKLGDNRISTVLSNIVVEPVKSFWSRLFL